MRAITYLPIPNCKARGFFVIAIVSGYPDAQPRSTSALLVYMLSFLDNRDAVLAAGVSFCVQEKIPPIGKTFCVFPTAGAPDAGHCLSQPPSPALTEIINHNDRFP